MSKKSKTIGELGYVMPKEAIYDIYIKNTIVPICRNCDIVMKYEEENPVGYLLFKCFSCDNRIGLQININKIKQ